MPEAVAKASTAMGQLVMDGVVALGDVPGHVRFVRDELGHGAFVEITAPKAAAWLSMPVGRIALERFTACFRPEPWWMKPCAGEATSAIPAETQFLLTAMPGGQFGLYVPILDGAMRCSLEGAADGQLMLLAETGDPAVVGARVLGLYVAVGPDPYVLCEEGAKSVMHRMGTGRLRREKMLPAFVEDFGWCTWDAFYQDVSHEKVREGLQSFKAGGVEPRLLILDDGWQSVEAKNGEHQTGEKRLVAFPANEKFPNDLGPTVRMAKEDFAVRTFLVWHAFQAYWGGVDGKALPGYGVRDVARAFGPGMLKHMPNANVDWWGSIAGVVPGEHIARFYQDYHRHLRQQGVDGVKVDNQSTQEGLGAGEGGRVTLMQRYHEGLEGSVHTHFSGNLINCMSCNNEMLYSALNSNLTRSSTDFWPKRPETHGLHLYTNSQVGMWFGEFIHPDWDMFQSGHECGAFHAAGRAISGGPVYVSDKPDAHNFELLRKLVDSQGRVLRWPNPGRPTRDNLFVDPTKEDALLKIFNSDGKRGIVGLFNGRYHAEAGARKAISGKVTPKDVEALGGAMFAVYLHRAEKVHVLALNRSIKVTLKEGEWELASVVPVEDGFAAIGLADKFNSTLGVLAVNRVSPKVCRVRVAEGQRFVAWSEKRPRRVTANGATSKFAWSDGTLEVGLPPTATSELEIQW